jgi:alkylation response protein AidB-like acyl-CoA dehydrogenase
MSSLKPQNVQLKPSSGDAGFFQERPRVPNQWEEDRALRRISKIYLPSPVLEKITPELKSWADTVLTKKVLTWVADAERNLPFVRSHDTFGKRYDELVTSEGWRFLQDLGIKEGIVAIPFENEDGEYSRVHQFLKYHLWSGSNAGVTCPSAMTDGAAAFITRHLARPDLDPALRTVLENAYARLTSRNPEEAWTSGQWMTERPGGSDVSFTETLAVPAAAPLQARSTDGGPLGAWSINGFKWFSSATDAQITILLARTPEGKLSTFLAPLRRTTEETPADTTTTVPNGVAIQRLKAKLGTKPLPTAELVLTDMRAHLVGPAGQGIKEISTILNITRVHNAVSSVGSWGRGRAVKRAFARVRRVAGGTLLVDLPAHVAVMARDEVEYRGWMHVAFWTTLLLGMSEQPLRKRTSTRSLGTGVDPALIPAAADIPHLLRVLTPVLKAGSAKSCIAGLQECVEGLGGVGFCENEEADLNVARLYRDANVLSIWEGTTETLAWDLVKVLKGRSAAAVLQALNRWVQNARPSGEVTRQWLSWAGHVAEKGENELLVSGREVLFELGRVVGAVLLEIDARSDGDAVAAEVARRWVVGQNDWKGQDLSANMAEVVQMNRRIVFGDGEAENFRASL